MNKKIDYKKLCSGLRIRPRPTHEEFDTVLKTVMKDGHERNK